MKKFYQLTQDDKAATITIYGDITSYPWFEGDVSSANLSNQLDAMKDVDEINVYINSYGGEVKEGIAIYNALRRHKAKVRTICDGFACSIASVIFMAGDERVMNEASALMIHNAWTFAEGNAAQLRKQAEDLEKITQLSIESYKANSSLEEEKIVELMDNESWILPEEAIEYGFATMIEKTKQKNASQNARRSLLNIIKMAQQAEDKDEDEETSPDEENPEEMSEETPDDETEDEEPDEGEETEDDSEDDEEPENPAQRMERFFNAFLNIERSMKNEY